MRGILIISLLVLSALVFQGCSATYEVKKMRRENKNNIRVYDAESGYLVRKPPYKESIEEKPKAMPKGTALSYSPITGETTVVTVPKGRSMKANPNPPIPRRVTVYNPFTNELLEVVR